MKIYGAILLILSDKNHIKYHMYPPGCLAGQARSYINQSCRLSLYVRINELICSYFTLNQKKHYKGA